MRLALAEGERWPSQGSQGPRDPGTGSVGMIVGLASWVMMFGSLLLAYVILRVQQPVWPPPGSGSLPVALGWVSTGVLLLSSGTMGVAHWQAARRAPWRRWVGVTTGLGLAFLCLQLLLWQQSHAAGVVVAGVLGSVFYVLSGLHGLHIVGGLAALIWLWVKGDVAKSESMLLVSMFWHFLDVVWIAMFVGIFLV